MLTQQEYAAFQHACALRQPTPEAEKLLTIASWLALDLADGVNTDETELKRYYNELHDILPALVKQHEEYLASVNAKLQAQNTLQENPKHKLRQRKCHNP